MENYCQEHSKDLPSTTLIPEQNDFVLARLHASGPSYVVAPDFEKRLNEKRRQLLAEENPSLMKINNNNNKPRKRVMMVCDDDVDQQKKEYEEYFDVVDEDEDNDEEDATTMEQFDENIEKAFASGSSSPRSFSNNNQRRFKNIDPLARTQIRVSAFDESVHFMQNSTSGVSSPLSLGGTMNSTRSKMKVRNQQQQQPEDENKTSSTSTTTRMLLKEQHELDKLGDEREQPRIRDDDTTAVGLAKMMRAHVATRKIQRWFRSLYYLRRDLSVRMIQRVCRGFLVGRFVVAKIPIYSEVWEEEEEGQDQEKKTRIKISRVQFFAEKIQRIGRGFIHARKRLHNQYEHETFDRTIGRFAAQMGLRSCLTTKSNNNQNNQQQNNNKVTNASFGASPSMLMENFWSSVAITNVVVEGEEKESVVEVQDSYHNQQRKNSASSFHLEGTSSNNNKSAYSSFRQLASSIRRQDSLAATTTTTSYHQDRKPEEVRLKYATTTCVKSSSPSVERKNRQLDQGDENENEEEENENDEDELFDSSPFFSKKRLRRNQEEYERLLAAEEVEAAKRLEAERRKNLRWNRPERATMPKEENQADADILSKFI